jgi:hypothetical protein
VTLALAASGKSVPQYAVPIFRQMALLVCGIVDEPVLGLARIAPTRRQRLGMHRRQSAVHVTHVPLRHSQRGGNHANPIGAKITILERGGPTLSGSQLKKQLWSVVVPIFTSDHDRKMYPEWQP